MPRVTNGAAPSRVLYFYCIKQDWPLLALCSETFPREGCHEKEQLTGEEDWALNRAESTAVSTT